VLPRAPRIAATVSEQRDGVGGQAVTEPSVRQGVGVDVGLPVPEAQAVRSATLEQACHRLHHERDRFDGAHVVIGGDHAERLHVGGEAGDLCPGQLAPVHPGRRGAFEQRVVDVRDVLHVDHPMARRAEETFQHVEDQVGVGVPEMGGVIGGDAADVEPDLAGQGLPGESGLHPQVELGHGNVLPGIHGPTLTPAGHSGPGGNPLTWQAWSSASSAGRV